MDLLVGCIVKRVHIQCREILHCNPSMMDKQLGMYWNDLEVWIQMQVDRHI
jgi:hypothetical protein